MLLLRFFFFFVCVCVMFITSDKFWEILAYSEIEKELG